MKKQFLLLFFLFWGFVLLSRNEISRLSLYFETDKHDLINQHKLLIDIFLDSVKIFNINNTNIIGHTDSIGNMDYNFNLSLKRAYSVLNYLIEKGFNRDSIEVKYFGENRPEYDNNTEGGKQRNRRTDIVFCKIEKKQKKSLFLKK
jgi:outer membrane protein OmpA-like peptidoglycan-associated protein